MLDENSSIDKTKGLCLGCLNWVDAVLLNKQGAAYLETFCVKDGYKEHFLSAHAQYFKELRDFYFFVTKEVYPQTRYLLFFTARCNLSCPICFIEPHSNEVREISLGEIRNLPLGPKKELILFGAEPTYREDLFEIVKYVKKKQHAVSLYTNGVKLVELNYLRQLKRSGVDKVYFQFDGFKDEVYEVLRNKKLVQEKMKVLDNLKSLNMPAVLDASIVKGVNEKEVGGIFDFALRNDYIRAVNFIAYVRCGCGRDYLGEGSLTPDELIDMVIEYAQGKITRRGILVFQKLLYVYMALLKRRTCFYIQYYWVYRKSPREWLSFEQFINLDILDKLLDKYAKIKDKNVLLSKIYLFFNMPKMVFAIRSPALVFKMLLMAMSHALRIGEYAKNDSGFLQLIFATACDPYKADKKIVERCHVGIIYKNAGGEVIINQENGAYLLERESKVKVPVA